jgi:hypothetical protein
MLFLGMLVFAILCSHWTNNENREWWSCATAWILSASMTWIGVSILTLFGPLMFSRLVIWGISTVTVSGVVGFVVLVAGHFGFGPPTPSGDRMGAFISLLFNKTIAAYLFGLALIIFTVRALAWWMTLIGEQLGFPWSFRAVSEMSGQSADYLNVILYTPFLGVVVLTVGLALFGIVMAYLINLNQFSLQAVYRDRLMRVFLGASDGVTQIPSPVSTRGTTFLMRQLWTRDRFRARLLPVINLTVDLVGGRSLGSRSRSSEGFTVSPLHCGSSALGYRRTDGPEGARYGGGISLGRVMALSGAATSPNMGYYTSPLVRLVFTLLNVRLG